MAKVKALDPKAKKAADKAQQEISVLQQKIEKIKFLNETVKKRAVFEKKKSELETYLEDVKSEKDFLTENHFKFKFQSGRYNGDEIFSISSPEIIEQALVYFSGLFNIEILKKDAEIEKLMKL